jgi:exosortase A
MSATSLPIGTSNLTNKRSFGGVWKSHLTLLAATWAVLLLLFWQDGFDMSMIWWDSSTFNHCLLIVPILAWLVIQRQDQLQELTPQAYWPALLYVAAGAAGWLLGDAASVAVARQLGLIMMLQGSIAACLGLTVARGLLFPLFYMFFLLPVGEEAVPMLQTITAKMCMLFLGWANIPAFIEGIFISTPTGYFKVAEACSGVKFLIAMIAYGALVANLCFKSWYRRAAFMLVCAGVPIVANGLRAFGTIYIAHHTNISFAAGFDHVFYGWIFFAIVIALVMAIGWRFFDKSADEIAFDPAVMKPQSNGLLSAKTVLALLLVVAASPVAWSKLVAANISAIPAQIAMPQVAGWKLTNTGQTFPWKPRFDGASKEIMGRYENADGENADLYIAVFDRQSEGRELIGFGQGAVDPGSKWAWTADLDAPHNAKAERITAPGPVVRDVVSYYRVAGVTSGSAGKIKLATLKTRLLGGDQQAVAIVISAEHRNNHNSRPAIDAFIIGLSDIDNLADQMAGLR